ncbi:MAG: hypothetical protein RBQ77_01000 [Candidatus Methanomethylophilaceae archaeon]|jgi:hypothetical protein|nr:hypothetical protein [Candidatus Methanomethylophilaceae archaeon]NLF34289.1 hypothetical protein [Thermoplasmatales archaeon]
MRDIPGKVKTAGMLGMLGGVICIVGMVLGFAPETEAVVNMGLCMLAAVLFFAVAGAFRSGGPWTWDTLMLMTFLCAGVTVAVTVLGSFELYLGALLVLISVILILVAACPNTKRWITADRN